MSTSRRAPLSVLLGSALASGLSACGTCNETEHMLALKQQLGVDYLARRVDGQGDTGGTGPRRTTLEVGVPCKTATDPDACAEALDQAWPGPNSGWSRDCWMHGCNDYAIVATKGDTVTYAADVDGLMGLFGTVDSKEKALVLAHGPYGYYDTRCSSLREREGGIEMKSKKEVSNCPSTEEKHSIRITPDGKLKKLDVGRSKESGSCAGRRPAGLATTKSPSDHLVACHLATIAHLEAASVVAFERLAEELVAFGAPPALVDRARTAAADEVRHAEQMHALAESRGAARHPVVVAAPAARDLLAFAIENAVEGCVRETYGVVDAAFRAQRAPTAELRALYAEIATDEARHAELAWDVAAWVAPLLSGAERAVVARAARRAHRKLVRALAIDPPAALCTELGAPNAREALAMAQTLQRRAA